MGLEQTMRSAKIGEEATNAHNARKAKQDGVQAGREMRDIEIEREIRQQEMIEAERQKTKDLAMSSYMAGRQAGQPARQDYAMRDDIGVVQEMSPGTAQMVRDSAMTPEAGSGMMPEESSPAQDIIAQIDAAKNAGEDVSGMVASIPPELRGEINAIQKERALNMATQNGQSLTPTRVPEPVISTQAVAVKSPATQASKAIMDQVAQDEVQKQQALEQQAMQQAQMQAQQQR